jgi:phage-related protein
MSKKKRVVSNCRGLYCVYAIRAVKKLNRRGIAARIGDGYAARQAAGLAVAMTEEHAP